MESTKRFLITISAITREAGEVVFGVCQNADKTSETFTEGYYVVVKDNKKEMTLLVLSRIYEELKKKIEEDKISF